MTPLAPGAGDREGEVPTHGRRRGPMMLRDVSLNCPFNQRETRTRAGTTGP